MRRFWGVVGVMVLAFGLAGCGGDDTQALMKCDDAMAKAANVAAMDNDAELIATTSECPDAGAWVAALKRHPGAGSLTSYTDQDAWQFLRLVCQKAAGSPTCEDAKAAGILD